MEYGEDIYEECPYCDSEGCGWCDNVGYVKHECDDELAINVDEDEYRRS